MKRSGVHRFFSALFLPYLPLAIVLFVLLFPFYWMVMTSFKSLKEIFDYTNNPLWVNAPSFDNYKFLFEKVAFTEWAVNSLWVSGVTTVVSLVLSIAAGYALARLRFRGVATIGVLIFITYLVPRTVMFIPLAQVLAQIGLLSNISALTLV